MRYRYCRYYGAEWEENAYNEGLKYPLFRIHESEPSIVAESKQIMRSRILEDRIRDAINDEFTPLKPWDNKKRDCFYYVAFKITNQDLPLPFQQLVYYYLKPAIQALRNGLRAEKIKTVAMVNVRFERLPSGLLVDIDIYE